LKKFDKILFGLVIGFLFPVLIGMLSFIIWFYFDRQETHALIYSLIGLLGGLLIDFIFLKRLVYKRYELPVWFVAGLYILYNIGVYGFFMGFPVFNALLGLFAGYYFGNRISFYKISSERQRKLINKVIVFTGLIMTFICISSGFLALVNNEASGMIKEVLGLSIEVTMSMVWGIVLIGGLTLILINMLLTRIIMIKIIKYNAR
jgi:hypothetical protein